MFLETLSHAVLALFSREVLSASVTQSDVIKEYPAIIEQSFIPAGSARLKLAAERPREPKKVVEDSYGVITQSKSVIVTDLASGATIFSKNPDAERSIGSITKLLTALVFLEKNPDLQLEEKITWFDYVEGGREYVKVGEKLKVADILGASLVGSDNMATLHLSGETKEERADFVERMNSKARELGLSHTRVVDPVGLESDNVSTARDLSVLLSTALAHPTIAQYIVKDSLALTVGAETVEVLSTNELISMSSGQEYRVLGGKTGYIPEAGYCLAAAVESRGNKIIIVVLGAPEKEQRFTDVQNLALWTFKTFSWD